MGSANWRPVPKRVIELRDTLYCHWPPSGSFLFLGAALAVAGILNLAAGGVAPAPTDFGDGKFGHREWQTFVATVSSGLAISVLLLIRGVTVLRRTSEMLPHAPGAPPAPELFPRDPDAPYELDQRARRPPRPAPSPTARPAKVNHLRHHHAPVDEDMIKLYGGLALLWVVCLGITVTVLVHTPDRWQPINAMGWRLTFTASLGVLCATPWVAISWLLHQATRPYWIRAHGTDPNAAIGVGEANRRIHSLMQLWEQIVGVGLAFAVFVAVSVIPTGALRNLWLSKDVPDTKVATDELKETFPSSDVLLYGAMWALIAGAVVIPLVFSWRTAAQDTVDRCFPPNATTAKQPQVLAARAALEGMLNLNSGLFRNPLTVLTLATPLITAALAAFVPELGTSPSG